MLANMISFGIYYLVTKHFLEDDWRTIVGELKTSRRADIINIAHYIKILNEKIRFNPSGLQKVV